LLTERIRNAISSTGCLGEILLCSTDHLQLLGANRAEHEKPGHPLPVQLLICTQETASGIQRIQVGNTFSVWDFICLLINYINLSLNIFQPIVEQLDRQDTQRTCCPIEKAQSQGGRGRAIEGDHYPQSKSVPSLFPHNCISLLSIHIADAKGLSSHSQHLVTELRDRAQDILFQIVKELHPAQSASSRFGNLLLLLPTISVRD
jgi:hypothetical protein